MVRRCVVLTFCTVSCEKDWQQHETRRIPGIEVDGFMWLLLLCLCIFIDKYALFCILFANWHSPATLTEFFSVLFPQL